MLDSNKNAYFPPDDLYIWILVQLKLVLNFDIQKYLTRLRPASLSFTNREEP